MLPMSPANKFRTVANTYPDQTPHQILTRNYPVAQLTWGPSGISPAQLTFPQALFNAAPVLLQRLVNFRYLRAGIKLEVRINSTAFHMGAMMVSWLPDHNGNYHAHNLIARSGNHPLVISASTQQAVSLTIPWINPRMYTDLTVHGPPTTPSEYSIATVWFDAIAPLVATSTAVSDTITVQVFASLMDPEVSGYIAQSGKRIRKEAEDKSKMGVLTESTSPLLALLEKVPIIGEIAPILASLAIFDKPTSVVAAQPTTLTYARGMSMGEGLDNCDTLSLLPNPVLSFDPGLMGDEADTTLINNIISVPMLRDTVTISATDLNYKFLVHPFDAEALKGNLDYTAFMSSFFQYWRGSMKYSFMFFTTAFTSARFRITVLYNTPTTIAQQYGDAPSMIVDVKGDTVCNFTVPYLAPLMQLQLSDTRYMPTVAVTLVSPIIGSSEGDPVIELTVWRSAGPDFQFSQMIGFTPLENTIPSKDVKSPATSANRSRLQKTLPKQEKAQTDIRSVFKTSFTPVTEGSSYAREYGVVSPEAITSIRQMTRRYSTSVPNANYINTFPVPDQGSTGAFNVLSRIFKFWRGARRIKANFSNGVDLAVFGMDARQGLDINSGVSYTFAQTWNDLTVEVPYYCDLPFVPIILNETVENDATLDIPQTILTEVDLKNINYFVSGGDDFTFGFLCSPLLVP